MRTRPILLPEDAVQPFSACALFETIENLQKQLKPDLQWQRLRLKLVLPEEETGGLCVNIVKMPPTAFQPFSVQFHQRGLKRLLDDLSLQESIAHAYWQTCWAGGAIRATRGESEPVAFIAIDRSAAFRADQAPFELEKISSTRAILGREAILLHQLRQAAGAIFWKKGRFSGDSDAELLAWLNQRAFVDRFVAQNRALPEQFQVQRFVPVAGSHTITALLKTELEHFCDPHWQEQTRHVQAAINGGFFLNFPEEYQNPWCAMNDPVGLIILAGQIRQLPLVARSAVLVGANGEARIERVSMLDVDLRLPWENQWRSIADEDAFLLDDGDETGKKVVVFTPAFRADEPSLQQKTPNADRVDLVVVFGDIVECRTGGGCDIPANGIVISVPLSILPDADICALLQKYGRSIAFRLQDKKFGAEKILTAAAAGPALLQDGEPLLQDFFEQQPPIEQFLPAQFDADGSVQVGVAPTRFPHNTDRTRAPRTILGVTPEQQLLLAVIDGRLRAHSLGATLQEAAGLAQAMGCKQALNLDGGGSSVLMFASGVPVSKPLLPEITAGIANIPSDDGHKDRLMPVPMMITGNQERRSRS